MTEKNTPILSPEYLDFRNEITSRIRSPQYEALKAVNKEMIALYWEIGRRITEQQAALGWGKSVMENLSRYIQKEFLGIKGFGVSNMWDMARFYTEYRSNEILQPLVGEISWSKHIVILTKCKEMQLLHASQTAGKGRKGKQTAGEFHGIPNPSRYEAGAERPSSICGRLPGKSASR